MGSRMRKTTLCAPVRAEEGRTKAGCCLRRSRDEPAGDERQGELLGARPVRSSGHNLSFVPSMSPPEIVGTADSTVCTLHLNKAGQEAGGEEGEGAVRKGKVREREGQRHLPA